MSNLKNYRVQVHYDLYYIVVVEAHDDGEAELIARCMANANNAENSDGTEEAWGAHEVSDPPTISWWEAEEMAAEWDPEYGVEAEDDEHSLSE